jgi:hypothetical protein
MKRYVWFVAFLFVICCAFPCFAAHNEKNYIKISRSFMGAYKKMQPHYYEVTSFLDEYQKAYGVEDLELLDVLIAILLYESGGNPSLVSSAGAKGLLQVIESTRIMMGRVLTPKQSPMEKFEIGDSIIVAVDRRTLNVRRKPSLKSRIVESLSRGTKGKIVGGPVGFGGYIWWKVEYENNVKGWSVGVSLARDLSKTEAGAKYLCYLADKLKAYLSRQYQLGSDDELEEKFLITRLFSNLVLAYNGGLGRVKNNLIRVESYQYLQGVSTYYRLLSLFKDQIMMESFKLSLIVLEKPHTWKDLSDQYNVSVIELRLYNPFMAARFPKEIPAGEKIVFSTELSGDIEIVAAVKKEGTRFYYEVRHGDILHHISNAFFRTKESSSSPPFSIYDQQRDVNGALIWGSFHPGTPIDVTDSPYLDIALNQKAEKKNKSE